MQRRHTPMAAAVLALAMVVTAGAGTAFAGEPDAAQQQALLDLVDNTCVGCHGPTLAGDVGPALTPDALKDRDPKELAATILNGRPDTQMPAFTGMISEDDAAWLAGQLKAGLK